MKQYKRSNSYSAQHRAQFNQFHQYSDNIAQPSTIKLNMCRKHQTIKEEEVLSFFFLSDLIQTHHLGVNKSMNQDAPRFWTMCVLLYRAYLRAQKSSLWMIIVHISKKGRTQCKELPHCAGSGEGCQWQALPSHVQCEETANCMRLKIDR